MSSQSDPISRFEDWIERARGAAREVIPEPTAFALATATPGGEPSVRMLLLKQVDSSGFTFYTNLESRKSRELLSNSAAAMCFHWAPLELQVRVEGRVSGVSAEDADAYFASRARESQLGAWASAQSTVIPHDGDLERSYAAMERRFQGRSVPRPSRWSGFLLVPHAIEFWQGQPHRLHRRELYTLLDGEWKVDRLYP